MQLLPCTCTGAVVRGENRRRRPRLRAACGPRERPAAGRLNATAGATRPDGSPGSSAGGGGGGHPHRALQSRSVVLQAPRLHRCRQRRPRCPCALCANPPPSLHTTQRLGGSSCVERSRRTLPTARRAATSEGFVPTLHPPPPPTHTPNPVNLRHFPHPPPLRFSPRHNNKTMPIVSIISRL